MLSRTRSSDSLPPLQSMAEVRIKKEQAQSVASNYHVVASTAGVPRSPLSHPSRIKTSDSPRNPIAHAHRASPRHSQQQPVFSDETPQLSQEEYAMQWNIVASASEPQPHHHHHSTANRSATTCPVRGCSQRYVNKKSLQKHMLTMHRGAKATREMAASLQTTPTGRVKKVRSSSSSAQSVGEQRSNRSTPTSTPRKSPRKPMTASQSPPPKLSHAADGTVLLQTASDEEDEEDDSDESSGSSSETDSEPSDKPKSRTVTKVMTMPSYFEMKVPGNVHLPIKSGRVGGALAAAAGVSTSVGRIAAAAAASSSSSSTPRQPQQPSNPRPSTSPSTDTTAQSFPHPNRTFPSYQLAQAFPAATKDGSHPLLALLTKNFSSYMHTPLPTQSDRFTVDELFVAYLLHKYDARAFLDRLGYQSLLARCMWIRGGLERWARNWKRYATNDSPARPSSSSRSRRSNSSADLLFPLSQESFGTDEDDEEAFWRRFTLTTSYPVTLLLTRIESFLTVTFEHGEGRSVPTHEQVEKKNIIAQMRKWVQSLKKRIPSTKPVSNPVANKSKAASTSNSSTAVSVRKNQPSEAQFSPTKFLRPTIAVRRKRSNSSSSSSDDSSPSSSSSSSSSSASSASSSRSSSPAAAPSASQEAAAALAASNTAFASLVAADRSKNWTKASLEQLNSLLLSNDGKVDRNLSLRQIADTLGKTTDEVRFQVAQIRKLKEIEESRATSRVEREKLEQIQEKVRQREAKKLATAAAKSKKGAVSAASPSPTRRMPVASSAAARATTSMLDLPMHFEFSSLLDSSIVPTVGLSKKRRKRKAGSIETLAPTLFDAQLAAPRKGGNNLAKEEKLQMQQMKAATVAAALAETSAATASGKKKQSKKKEKEMDTPPPSAVLATKSPKRKKAKEDDEDEEEQPGVASRVMQPPAKKQRKSKSNTPAAAAAQTSTHPLMPLPFSPQQPHQYAMMPYPNFYPGAYPPYPHMMPPPPIASMSPTKASSKKRSKSKSSDAAAAAQLPPAMYPGYSPPPFAHPWAGGMPTPGGAGGAPPFAAPVGPDGRPMQWSWMLVPVPAAPHPSQMVVIDDEDEDD